MFIDGIKNAIFMGSFFILLNVDFHGKNGLTNVVSDDGAFIKRK